MDMTHKYDRRSRYCRHDKKTPIHQQPENFWASDKKKINIQLLCRDIVSNEIPDYPRIFTRSSKKYGGSIAL